MAKAFGLPYFWRWVTGFKPRVPAWVLSLPPALHLPFW